MHTVAGLDNGVQSRFEVGDAGRNWLKNDLAKVAHDTPLIVFSHSPLYKYYRDWNFWTDDADEVQAILKPYQAGDRDARPHASDAVQPHRQHRLPRLLVDGVAVAVCAAGSAGADRFR